MEKIALFVICEETRLRITRLLCEKVSDLTSTQEEADTQTLLHALHAVHAGYNTVVITADDIDFLILCLGFNNDIPCPIYIYIKKERRGTQSCTWFFVVGKVARALGHDIFVMLYGVHAFTGCDTVSACAGHGKIRIFKHVKKNKTYEEAFCWLVRPWDVSA